jgi:hypothetical protein
MKNDNQQPTQKTRLVDAPTLIKELFDPSCAISIRTLRTLTAQQIIPFYRVGGQVFFDVEQVRAHFFKQKTAQPKN